MKIIPAIDLWEGNVVRFLRGNPDNSTVYGDQPLATAKKWEEEGAEVLHLVDLSAALGRGNNTGIVARIIKEVKIPVEVGGGVRNVDYARRLFDMGAERVIVGTKSVDESFLDKLLDALGGDHLAVGVDVIDGKVAIQGWQFKTNLCGNSFIDGLVRKGIKWIIYTDISRDGALRGPNLDVFSAFSGVSGVNFIASGGISCMDDFRRLKEKAPFVWGVITGRALYEGKFTLRQANSL